MNGVSANDRACTGCGDPIEAGRRSDTKFCHLCYSVHLLEYSAAYQRKRRADPAIKEVINARDRERRRKGRVRKPWKIEKLSEPYDVRERRLERMRQWYANLSPEEKKERYRRMNERRKKRAERFKLKKRPPREDRWQELTVPDYLRTRD